MNAPKLFSTVKESFCSLWDFKERGNTLEIITPIDTPTSKFVSVFITIRDGRYIVTDGGWLHKCQYQNQEYIEEKGWDEVLEYFMGYYQMKKFVQFETPYYFKATEDEKYIPNLVYDVSSFVSRLLSTVDSRLSLYEHEKMERENFQTRANDFIRSIVGPDAVIFNQPVPDIDNIRFSARIQRGNNIILMKYVTGTNFQTFRGSASIAAIEFERAHKSGISQYIKGTIALLNNEAGGFDQKRLAPYLESLESNSEGRAIPWYEKEKLYTMIA